MAMQESWERSDSLKNIKSETESQKSENQNNHLPNHEPENNDPPNHEDKNSKGSSGVTRKGDERNSENGTTEIFSANEIEGVFFELVSRALLVMNYADNGRSSRAISHFTTIYRDILEGMEMEDEFKEFMFMTGLYNYYREAYPEAYPVYKAPLVFFRRGDKVEGLNTLRRAATETDFIRVEATMFLSNIHMNFENNPDSSLYYASLLHQTYPGNAYFHAKFAEMLLINGDYEQALVHLEELRQGDSYNRMKAAIYRGIYEEKHKNNPERAKWFYEEGLRLSIPFGNRANYAKAYAYIGLSRYYKNRDDKKKAKEYYKKAKNSSGYGYVFK